MNVQRAFRSAAIMATAGIVVLFCIAVTLAFASPASAKGHRRHYVAQGELRHAQNYQPWAWSNLTPASTHPVLSAQCQIARSLGGPCGCFTSEYFFGHSIRDLWRHDAWLRFPRAAPAAGTAAIWLGGRHTRGHVAPVIAANGDGTVTISDNIGTRRVSERGLIFVSPHS